MKRIRFLKDDTYDFLKSFDDNLVSKIFGLFEILEEVGVYMDPSKLKKISKEIYELRITGKTSIRILITFANNEINVLHAFIKKTQKIPKKELELAIHRLKYLQ